MILPRPKSRRAIQPRSSPPVIPATHGISIPEPLLLWMAGFFLGADHTKEFLSFGRQPSFFKGRNQSWFHPLRTPSRPGAAAPGPHRGWGQAGGLSHAIDRLRPTDRQLLGVGVLLTSCGVLGTKRSSCHEGGRAGLGAVYTKESLSFGKQPSLFKGRNQSWFHPLRTPSRPGAAAPGPHGGLGVIDGFFAYHRPAAMHRPPAARFWGSVGIVWLF